MFRSKLDFSELSLRRGGVCSEVKFIHPSTQQQKKPSNKPTLGSFHAAA